MHLDLSGARRNVPRKFIDKAVRRSENRLTRVTINRFDHVDVLKNVAKACKSLTELDFLSLPHAMSSTLIDVVQYATKLERFVVQPLVTMDTVTQILNTRPTLKHVKFDEVRPSRHAAIWKGPFPSLESITMHYQQVIAVSAASSLTSLLHLTPNLKSLDVEEYHLDMTFLSPLATLPLTTLVLRAGNFQFPTLPTTLQKLSLDYMCSYELSPQDGPVLLRSRLPSLTHLSLIDVNDLCADRLEELLDMYTDTDGQLHTLKDARPLQSLTIRGIPSDDNVGLFNPKTNSLFTRSPRMLTPALQHLDVAKMGCDDDDVEHLLTHQTGLKSIDLSYTRISGASIKMLVDKLPSLRVINADNCSRISGRDAIEYARRKGVSVSCSMGEGKGSRKVRY
jgi:F-box/TPR repeat protein Pof3